MENGLLKDHEVGVLYVVITLGRYFVVFPSSDSEALLSAKTWVASCDLYIPTHWVPYNP